MENPKYRKVVLADYSNFEAGLSNNGGRYGFWITAEPVDGDAYELDYRTTAEFEYCSYCGAWGSCICGDVPQIISTRELDAMIYEYNNNPSEGFSAEVTPWSLDMGKLRRRVEDALRKSDQANILIRIANLLNVAY